MEKSNTRTTISIDTNLIEALDKALLFEQKRGNKYIKTRNQLAIKILWDTLKEDYP